LDVYFFYSFSYFDFNLIFLIDSTRGSSVSALLSIHTIQKALSNTEPLVRALAVKELSSLLNEELGPIFHETLTQI
jgi:vesicle coat complex subunit